MNRPVDTKDMNKFLKHCLGSFVTCLNLKLANDKVNDCVPRGVYPLCFDIEFILTEDRVKELYYRQQSLKMGCHNVCVCVFVVGGWI